MKLLMPTDRYEIAALLTSLSDRAQAWHDYLIQTGWTRRDQSALVDGLNEMTEIIERIQIIERTHGIEETHA
jgi:hypothetical protein